MEKTISRILEIEEKANLIIERANNEKRNLYKEFEEDLIREEKQIADDTSKRINQYKAKMEEELEEETSVFSQKSEQQLKDLDAAYQNHKSEIVQKIFEDIIGS